MLLLSLLLLLLLMVRMPIDSLIFILISLGLAFRVLSLARFVLLCQDALCVDVAVVAVAVAVAVVVLAVAAIVGYF